ncbi:carboxypeptidase S1-like protein B [Aulographum hederae CBS 113979]|uniref:Carboxypeptidase n=1 Tax=Aulographum hederae CBS 113979 TaxID=1176131 RepID=A0A6G1H6T5_9PEZI|nr:carboxypeptidase S1-like protein B [Aulographum hederae CBS 113979]
MILPSRVSLLAPLVILPYLVQTQFPKTPEDVTVLQSQLDDGVYISYKEPGLCETTPGVKSYSGYVHLPPGTLAGLDEEQDYPINTFFWFFEARNDPHNAPLSIWMNGGPGSSSMLGLLVENGPCSINADSNSTTHNPWSWNNNVNMLYLDQPVQVGLSYDVLTNITVDLLYSSVTVLQPGEPIPEQTNSVLVGTYPSQNRTSTAVGTENAARALWHFAQTWFQEFPAYKPNDSRVSIATESYGGRYGPAFTAFFEEQNDKILNGTWDDAGDTYLIHLDTLMIINGCIDRQVQWPSYPHIAFNNTYGIQSVNESTYNYMVDALNRPGGCRDQINECRSLASKYDPTNQGFNDGVNLVCQAAESFCSSEVRGPYLEYSGRNYYDYATFDPDPFPPPFYEGWLNQAHVQAALGVPLNWTQSSGTVSASFRSIGDYNRPGWLEDLAFLLESGIKVSLVYGDRDFACNWIGGEAVSLAIDYTNTSSFHAAGYEGIRVNETYIGGQVRQYGNLSFARVYEAGHEIPSYQPEAALRIFERALFNRDIATGDIDTAVNTSYGTSGPPDTWAFKNALPPQPKGLCYILDPEATCTQDQLDGISNNTVLVHDWIVMDSNTSSLFSPDGELVPAPTTILTGPSGTGGDGPTPSSTETGDARGMVDDARSKALAAALGGAVAAAAFQML